MKRFRLPIVIVMVAIAGAALIGPLGSAVAFFSRGLTLDVAVSSPSHLHARGASVNVPFQVVCNATRPVGLDATITERVGSSIANGEGFTRVQCTGDFQTVVVPITANGKAFKKGTGVVNVDIYGCGHRVCGSEQATGDTKITK
jgi:hypothetical protein